MLMFSNRVKYSFLVVFGCFLLWQTTASVAQDDLPFADFTGADLFEQSADKMSSLLQLAVVDGNLTVIPVWKMMAMRKPELDQEELVKAEIAKLVDRGLPEDIARRHAMRKLDRDGRFGKAESPLMAAFSDYCRTYGIGSSSRSGANDRVNMRMSSRNFAGHLQVDNEDFLIELGERELEGRDFILEKRASSVTIRFIGDDVLFDLRQKETGQVRLAVIVGDKAQVFVARDFSTFVTKHAQANEMYLEKLLGVMGVAMPVSELENEIRQAVVERIVATSADEMQVQQLVDQLVGDSFKVRDEAQAKLREKYFWWEEAINDQLKTKELTDEISKRVTDIRNRWPQDSFQDFAYVYKLYDSPRYLVRLLEQGDLNDASLILDRLKRKTGQDFGYDLEEWKEWVEDNL